MLKRLPYICLRARIIAMFMSSKICSMSWLTNKLVSRDVSP